MTTADTGKVRIHNKEYLTVALRVTQFRDTCHGWCIATEIVHRDDETVVMKASIFDETGVLKATGHSEEKRASSQINKTSALENAETSAIGRALAALGFVGTEFASADEVANAIGQQKAFSAPHKPSDGAMESLEVDMQTVVRETAKEVSAYMDSHNVAKALEWLEAANFTAEAKVACWALISAPHRSAIKKYQDGKKAVEGLKNMKDDIPV